MDWIDGLSGKEIFSKDEIISLLSLSGEESVRLRKAAFDMTTARCGNKVFLRGLVEFSNICTQNCFYCGIRRENAEPVRYTLTKAEILDCARFAANSGYGSLVLQSGERRDEAFITFVEELVRDIKAETRSPMLPGGLGITLSVGEQTQEAYRRFFTAGVHRYLLRIETTSPKLFSEIHPKDQSLEARLGSLSALREIGFQVGTGVMIGIPGQTLEDLAEDILFFAREDIDMIGMGPYIAHHGTPMQGRGMMEQGPLLHLALNMIAVVRLVLKDVNIAATTALQALVPDGREQGIGCGANVVMPNLTPRNVRADYQLYDGKPCIDEGREECFECFRQRILSAGREMGLGEWGDSRHFKRRHTV